MTVEELDIVISAQNREFNRAIDDVIGRLDGLEEQSRRTGDSIQGIFGNIAGKLAALGIGREQVKSSATVSWAAASWSSSLAAWRWYSKAMLTA